MPKTEELVEIEAVVKGQTKQAIRLYDGKTIAWVPKQYVKKTEDGTWEMPEWMALERGFI